MNEEFRHLVIEILRRGEDLPAEWARELFPPEKREYELVYHGKEREEDILANTMAVPLQSVTTFGKNGDDWHNMLIFGDNLQAMKELLKLKKQGKLLNADGTPGVRLVYIDPPFATKQDFRGSQDQKAYQDKIFGAKFLEFLRKRLVFLRELLSDDGTAYVHLDWRKGHYAKIIMDEVFGEHNFINEIVWCYKEREMTKTHWNRKHELIFMYSKGNERIFNWRSVAEGYSNYTLTKKFKYTDENGRKYRLRYKDGRNDPPFESKDTYRQYEDKGGVPPRDWWEIPIINQASYERIVSNRYPTQKPEALLERIIKASSNSGDIVLDAFAGSGTTCAVAEKLGRRWIGIDCGKLAIYTVQKRMLDLKKDIGNKGQTLKPKPFTLYNAGLYDFSTLRQLPWEDWRFFALQLFECKDEPHIIGGLQLDGKRRGASVLVFNHLEHPGQRIDEDTVYTIHQAVGKKIGHKFFIIAPRGAFDFQQDYIDYDGVRYYALRIPYSFINELHHKEFTALEQPKDETAVNSVLDAVGFDFIRPPQVKWSVGIAKRQEQLLEEAFLKVDSFESRAYIRGKDTRSGLETFSMLMLDFDYTGEIFNPDVFFLAQQLESTNWEIWFPKEELGEQVMVVFIDIYGNEAREVILREEFGDMSTKADLAETAAKGVN